jgi:hypothetical protein
VVRITAGVRDMRGPAGAAEVIFLRTRDSLRREASHPSAGFLYGCSHHPPFALSLPAGYDMDISDPDLVCLLRDRRRTEARRPARRPRKGTRYVGMRPTSVDSTREGPSTRPPRKDTDS